MSLCELSEVMVPEVFRRLSSIRLLLFVHTKKYIRPYVQQPMISTDLRISTLVDVLTESIRRGSRVNRLQMFGCRGQVEFCRGGRDRWKFTQRPHLSPANPDR